MPENKIEETISYKGNLTHQIKLIQNAEDFREMLNKITLLSIMLNPWKDKEYKEKVGELEKEIKEQEIMIIEENIGETAFTQLSKFSALLDLMKRKDLLFKSSIDV